MLSLPLKTFLSVLDGSIADRGFCYFRLVGFAPCGAAYAQITIASIEQQDNRIYFVYNVIKSFLHFENVYLRVGQLANF